MSADVSADVVVIGAGTAGCVVAGRLAERGDRQVLLIEAGPDYGSRDSGRWPVDLLDPSTLPTSHDWGYRGPSAGHRELAFDRARVVGGCSTHNGCTQSWGWAGDYDRWAASGLGGWSADELRPHFEAATTRMRVRRYLRHEVQPFHRAFVDACAGAGVAQVADLDSLDGAVGVDISPVNVAEGIRWNASFAYLDPVRGQGHLQVWEHAVVRRIRFSSGRVVGVEVDADGTTRTVDCPEVVLCAGTYGTPEVLARSGIGAASDVGMLGSEVVADLPGVGANLHDHPAVSLEFEASAYLVALMDDYRAEHGWLPEEQALAKLASSAANGPFDLHLYPWVEPRPESASGWAVVIPVGLLTPASRGRLRISADGSVTPDHGYLSDASDIQALADGLDFAQHLCTMDPLADLLGEPRNRQRSGEDLHGWMIRTHGHYWHPAGTAAMGASEQGGVCDADGRVHGVDGLRVADASIFPEVPRATPAMPVVVAGERIAAAMQ